MASLSKTELLNYTRKLFRYGFVSGKYSPFYQLPTQFSNLSLSQINSYPNVLQYMAGAGYVNYCKNETTPSYYDETFVWTDYQPQLETVSSFDSLPSIGNIEGVSIGTLFRASSELDKRVVTQIDRIMPNFRKLITNLSTTSGELKSRTFCDGVYHSVNKREDSETPVDTDRSVNWSGIEYWVGRFDDDGTSRRAHLDMSISSGYGHATRPSRDYQTFTKETTIPNTLNVTLPLDFSSATVLIQGTVRYVNSGSSVDSTRYFSLPKTLTKNGSVWTCALSESDFTAVFSSMGFTVPSLGDGENHNLTLSGTDKIELFVCGKPSSWG